MQTMEKYKQKQRNQNQNHLMIITAVMILSSYKIPVTRKRKKRIKKTRRIKRKKKRRKKSKEKRNQIEYTVILIIILFYRLHYRLSYSSLPPLQLYKQVIKGFVFPLYLIITPQRTAILFFCHIYVILFIPKNDCFIDFIIPHASSLFFSTFIFINFQPTILYQWLLEGWYTYRLSTRWCISCVNYFQWWLYLSHNPTIFF